LPDCTYSASSSALEAKDWKSSTLVTAWSF
jgi:hypothetical protein